jgi:hypothetical protein
VIVILRISVGHSHFESAMRTFFEALNWRKLFSACHLDPVNVCLSHFESFCWSKSFWNSNLDIVVFSVYFGHSRFVPVCCTCSFWACNADLVILWDAAELRRFESAMRTYYFWASNLELVVSCSQCCFSWSEPRCWTESFRGCNADIVILRRCIRHRRFELVMWP